MAVKLSARQERNIRDVLQVADEDGWTPMEVLAGIETIGVEANYENPDYGDRDSLGAFQQRTPWGSRESRLNVKESARRFGQRAKAARQTKQFKNAGDLAQAVQVSAFGGRYHEKRGEALQILKQFGGSSAAGGGGAGGTGLAADVNAEQPEGTQFDPTRGPVSLLEINRPQAPTATAPQAPAAATGPVMPEAYGGGQGAPMAGAPQPQPEVQLPEVADYSQEFGTPQAQQAPEAAGSDTGSDTAAPSGGAGAKPRVKIAAGANASGRGLQKPILGVLDEISSAADVPIVVTTGTNHSKYTVNGKISDHFGGNAADIAATGQHLTDLAVDALLTTARGKKVQWIRNDGRVVETRITAANARKVAEAGGIWNVPHGKSRVQVIANTHQGGDHTNHLHVGFAG